MTSRIIGPSDAETAEPSRLRVLRAELLRSRGTFTWGAVVVPLLLSLWCLRLAQMALDMDLATAEGRWDGGILGWLSFYPAVVALPIGLLTGAMTQWREQRCREGGTAWRAVSARRVLGARMVVLSLSALAAQVALLAPIVLHALLGGHGWGPWADWLRFGLLMWLAVIAAQGVGVLFARSAGGAAVGLAPVLGMIWSVAGAVRAESGTWILEPWSWMMRSVLPLLGVHGNSVELEPGAPAWAYGVWSGIALQAGLALLVMIAVLRTSRWDARRSSRAQRPAKGAETEPPELPASRSTVPTRPQRTELLRGLHGTTPRGHARVLSALLVPMPWRIWAELGLLLLGIMAVVRWGYSSEAAVTLLALLGVPVAACAVGAGSWFSLQGAWRGLLGRSRPGMLSVGTVLLGTGFLSAVLFLAWLVAAAGNPEMFADPVTGSGLGRPIYVLFTAPFVAFMLIAVSFALTQSAGLGFSIGLYLLGMLSGLVIAGNETLAGSALWRWAPWGWANVAGLYPQRWFTIVLVALAVGLVAVWASALSGRRAALRSL